FMGLRRAAVKRHSLRRAKRGEGGRVKRAGWGLSACGPHRACGSAPPVTFSRDTPPRRSRGGGGSSPAVSFFSALWHRTRSGEIDDRTAIAVCAGAQGSGSGHHVRTGFSVRL